LLARTDRNGFLLFNFELAVPRVFAMAIATLFTIS